MSNEIFENTSGEIAVKTAHFGAVINNLGTFGNIDGPSPNLFDANNSSIYSLVYNSDIIQTENPNNYNVIGIESDIHNSFGVSYISENFPDGIQFINNSNLLGTEDKINRTTTLRSSDFGDLTHIHWSGYTDDDSIIIRHMYVFKHLENKIDITTKITNNTGAPINNLKYFYSINPNFSSNPTELNTNNLIENENIFSAAYARNNVNDLGMVLYSTNSHIKASFGTSDELNNGIYMSDMLNNVPIGNWNMNQVTSDYITNYNSSINLLYHATDVVNNYDEISIDYSIQMFYADYFATSNLFGEQYMVGQYLACIINNYGTFGNMYRAYTDLYSLRGPTSDTYICLVYNPDNVNSYLTSVDAIQPGSPLNLFSLSYRNDANPDGLAWTNTRDYDDMPEYSNDINKVSLVNNSTGDSFNVIWTGITSDDVILITKTFSFDRYDTRINVNVTIQNQSEETITDLRYLFGFDSDLSGPDGPPMTTNIIRKQYAENGISAVSSQYDVNTGIILFTNDSNMGVAYGESGDYDGGFYIGNILNDTPTGNWRMNNLQTPGNFSASDDVSIYTMYNTESLLPSDSVNFTYKLQLFTGSYYDGLIDIPCFLKGTKILCINVGANNKEEYINIENLTEGTIVKTNRNGYKKIHSIKNKKMENINTFKQRYNNILYKYSKDKFNLIDDLIITGNHSVLVDNLTDYQRGAIIKDLKKIYVTENKYRLPAYIDSNSEIYENFGEFEIWHLALENKDIYMNYGIWANGLLVETSSIRTMNKIF